MDSRQLAAQLARSINQYEGILTLLLHVERVIGTASPMELQDMYNSLAELQQQATETDRSFLSQLPADSAKFGALGALFNQRTSVVKKVIALNKEITAKAIGVQSLLAHELGTLRTGLSALSGYKQQENSQGRIVNSRS